ncbi:12328_t:CDS:2 [Gigaspora margarita]|uniref:12328_t:CDS:1 n=1 Tax=Gigaspora margarita TaxID=4874 RepID=A0ABN7UYA0_GIGMA|nr:12328_t:CDS:2 [Gigaspora margarita]
MLYLILHLKKLHLNITSKKFYPLALDSIIVSDPNLIVTKHGAIASELVNCSAICFYTSAASVIAAQLCWLNDDTLPNGTADFIDCRETAPKAATYDMYKKHHTLSAIGGLAVGVPGEIRGMKLAHEKYGKLPWKRLFEPSIKLSRYGFPVPPELALRLKSYRKVILSTPSYHDVYVPRGRRNMTYEDFVNYQPIVREPVIGYYHGRKVTSPEPTDGLALIFMLNLLEGYNMSQIGLDGINL